MEPVLDPHSMAALIRIHIPNADLNPDLGGVKRAKMQGKTAAKRQIMGPKKYTKQCI
jgi:hypothetical protein